MLHRVIWGVLSVAILLFLPACTQFGDSNTNDLLADYCSASSPEELQAAISQLVQSDVEAEELASRLREGKLETRADQSFVRQHGFRCMPSLSNGCVRGNHASAIQTATPRALHHPTCR